MRSLTDRGFSFRGNPGSFLNAPCAHFTRLPPGACMKSSMFRLAPPLIFSGCLFFGCEDLGVTPPVLPSVVSFTADPNSVLEGDTIIFSFRAASQKGLARGIIDYLDGTKRDSVALSGTRDSAHASHVYLQPGWYKPTLTLEDVAGERSGAADTVYVRANSLPVITTSQLWGIEGGCPEPQ